MKKLFNEPEIEILKFLCNEGIVGDADSGSLGGATEEDTLPE